MNTGSTLAGRPSLGSWVTYGLGTENANLPGFVVMQDVASRPGGRRSAELGHGLHAGGLSGDPPRRWRRADRKPANARRRSARRGNRASSISWAGSITAISSPGSNNPSWMPGSRAMSWPSACRPRHPRQLTWQRDSRDPCPLRPGRAGDRHHRPPLSAGPPAGRAWRAVRPGLLRRGKQVGCS